VISNIFFLFKQFLFPGSCVLCNCSLINADEIKYSLCNTCRFSIDLFTGNKCNICGKPLISEKETCLPCRNNTNIPYERSFVLFPYTGKYRELLIAYKFRKNLSLAGYFAEKINEVIALNPFLKDAVIVPVPPRKGKIKDNGWDQVDYLVKYIKKQSAHTVCHCLKRLKSSVQKSLTRKERIENLKERIFLCKPAPQTVLLIDDVITTGSTMEVCAKTLKQGGTEKVYGLCLFYD
jgi:ComF family protein